MAQTSPRASLVLLIVAVALLFGGFIALTAAPIGLALLLLIAGVVVFTVYVTRRPTTRGPVKPWSETFLGGMNPYERALFVGGGAAMVVGVIGALVAANQAASARSVNDLVVVMGGIGDADAGSDSTAWMWVWIVVAVLGALSTLGFVAIRAARR